jgi:putative transposase
LAESTIGLYKTECVRPDGPFKDVDDLGLATLSSVHWFNSSRLHSAISYATPIEYEQAYYRQTADLAEGQPAEPSLH